MFLKTALLVALMFSVLFGYKVDNISSGTTLSKLDRLPYQSGQRYVRINMGLNMVRNGKDYLIYPKTIFGKNADITLYFTKKSKTVYKTKVTWGIMSGAFNSIGEINEKEKNDFFIKVRNLLSKKYKLISKNKFMIDKHSTVEIFNNASNIELMYIDNRYMKKNTKEEQKYNIKKHTIEYNKAFKDL